VNLDEGLRGRRSIRRYAERDVSDALLREVLDLARHAPSSMDDQPCCFVAIRAGDSKRRIAAAKNAHSPPDKRAFPADFVSDAPVVVAVCVERARAHGRVRENGVLATAFLLLAAHARGLSGVYLSAYESENDTLAPQIAALLGLPDGIQPVTLVPLGFPAEEPGAKRLRPLDEIVHAEAYGGPR